MLSSRLSAFGLLLLGLSWLGYDHYRPWVNFHSEALACLAALALLSGYLLSTRQRLAWPVVGWWLLLAALAPWLWWAAGIGLFAGDALIASMYVLLLAAAVTVGHAWARPADDGAPGPWLAALSGVTACAAVLSGTIGLVQWFGLSGPFAMYMLQPDLGDRALSNLGQPNQLGTLLLMGMAALLHLFETRRLGSVTFGALIAFLTLALIPAQSRTALLSVGVVTIFLFFKRSRLERLRCGPLLIWASLVVVLTAGLPAFMELALLGEGRGAESMTRTSDRLQIWRQVLAGIAQAPWLGYGWNQTPTAHAIGAAHVPGTMTFSYAHNLLLDLIAWNGIPVGLLWGGLLGWWLISRLWSATAPAAVAALAGLLPLAVHSMLEFPFAYAYFLLLGGLLVGVVEAMHARSLSRPVRRRWVWLLAVPWMMAGAYACHEYLQIEEDFRVVRFENLRIGKTPVEYVVPDVWLLSQLAEMLKAARVRPAPGMTAEAIEALRKVAMRFPWGALHLRYTYALALNGDPEGATRQMRIVRGMFGEGFHAAATIELQELLARHPQAGPMPQL